MEYRVVVKLYFKKSEMRRNNWLRLMWKFDVNFNYYNVDDYKVIDNNKTKGGKGHK